MWVIFRWYYPISDNIDLRLSVRVIFVLFNFTIEPNSESYIYHFEQTVI